MKVIRGMAVIFGFLIAGEALSFCLKIPVPGSVSGMVLMACGLGLKIIPLGWVEETASFFTGNLAFFFIPAGVGLTAHFGLLRREWPVILGVTVLSTFLVLVFVGLFHRGLKRKDPSDGIGTARAFENGPAEGAFSSLGLCLNGLATSILTPLIIRILF
jgi:holin-like protein